MAEEISDEARKQIARNLRTKYRRFYDLLVEHAGEDFLRYLYGLFMRVYELDYEGKYLTKTDAAEYVPIEHATTRRQYLEKAVQFGYLKFEPNPGDGRSEVIKPGRLLQAFVQGEVDTMLADMDKVVATIEAERRGSEHNARA